MESGAVAEMEKLITELTNSALDALRVAPIVNEQRLAFEALALAVVDRHA